MPQSRSKSSHRWYSAKYAMGYCHARSGRVYVRFADRERSTGLLWKDANKSQALKILDEFIAECLNPTASVPEVQKPQTVYELIAEFRRVKFPDMSQALKDSFRSAVKFYFPKNVALDYDTLTRHFLNTDAGALGQNTRRKYLLKLRTLFEFAAKLKYLPENPVEAVGVPQEKKKNENLVLLPEQVDRLVQYFEARNTPAALEYALLFRWQWLTGMRISETLGMKWTDIDERKIKILGKGSIYREFPLRLFPAAQKILDAQKEHNFEGEKVFRWSNPQNPQYYFREAREALGFDVRTTVHTLRASAGWYYENVLGLDFTLAAEILGHSREKISAKTHYRTIRGCNEGRREMNGKNGNGFQEI
jgi:integrase